MSGNEPPKTVYEDDEGPAPAGGGYPPIGQIPPYRGGAAAPTPAHNPIQPMGGRPPMAGGPKTRMDDDDEVAERLMGFMVIISSRQDEENRYFRLRKGVNWVGRFGSRAQVELRDQQVSQQHAILVCTNKASRLVDLDSANGSAVNGEKCEYATLSDGDTVAFGRTTCVFVSFPYVAED
jgi:hypothetical protein